MRSTRARNASYVSTEKSPRCLLVEPFLHLRRRSAPVARGTSEDADRATVNVEPLDVEDLEPEEPEVVDEGLDRVLRDVLVIHAVELVLLHELERMRTSTTKTPSSASSSVTPRVNGSRSPMWWNVLVETTTVGLRACARGGRARGKYSFTTSTPFSRASSAMFVAGSIPSVRAPRPRRNERNSPSLQPMSIVSACLSR